MLGRVTHHLFLFVNYFYFFGPQLAWHNLAVPHELLWDASLGSDDGRGRTVRELVARALRGPLAPAQQQQLFADLDAEPKLIYRCGLAPKRLPVSDGPHF